jgi:hypothetical protein
MEGGGMERVLPLLPSTSDSPTEGSLMKQGFRTGRQKSMMTLFTRFVDRFRTSRRLTNPFPRG